MPSLTLKSGTKVEVKKGYVSVTGQCVVLMSEDKMGEWNLHLAYCLQPGEIVRRTEDGEDYSVEY